MLRFFIISAALLVTGCWGSDFIDSPGRIRNMEAAQTDMSMEIDTLSHAVRENENLLRDMQARAGTGTADLIERLTALAAELDVSLRRLDGANIPLQHDSIAGSEAQLLFDEAYMQFQQGSFDIAARGFRELLENHPASALADDAMYFMAICWEETGQFHRATEDLVALNYLYPHSEWAPGALFRAGNIYGMHNAAAARDRLFELLLYRHPDSDEAALVRARQ